MIALDRNGGKQKSRSSGLREVSCKKRCSVFAVSSGPDDFRVRNHFFFRKAIKEFVQKTEFFPAFRAVFFAKVFKNWSRKVFRKRCLSSFFALCFFAKVLKNWFREGFRKRCFSARFAVCFFAKLLKNLLRNPIRNQRFFVILRGRVLACF